MNVLNFQYFFILPCLTPDHFTCEREWTTLIGYLGVFRKRRPTKTKTEDLRWVFVITKTKTHYENEDPLRKRRPTTKTKTHYENEDPLRKRRPIFVFVLRKRRPTTKTKTHLCFRTTKTKTIKYSFIRYFRENKRKSVAKNFR